MKDGGDVKVIVRAGESERDLVVRKSKEALVVTDEWWKVMYYEGLMSGDTVRGWGSRLDHQKILIKLTAVKRPRLPLP